MSNALLTILCSDIVKKWRLSLPRRRRGTLFEIGACGTCPSSTVTMKMGIERVLNEKFGAALKGVVQVDQQQIGATVMGVNAHLEMLRPAIHNYGGFVEVVSVDSSSGIAVVKYKGPAPIGMGIQAAIKDKFPDMKEVLLVDENRLVQV